jgi:hypothetical protein
MNPKIFRASVKPKPSVKNITMEFVLGTIVMITLILLIASCLGTVPLSIASSAGVKVPEEYLRQDLEGTPFFQLWYFTFSVLKWPALGVLGWAVYKRYRDPNFNVQ